MRFVEANMNARKFTTCAPFANSPLPMATAPKLQPLLAAPNAVAIARLERSSSPSTRAIRSFETYTWTRLVIVSPMMIAQAAVQRNPSPIRSDSRTPSRGGTTIHSLSDGSAIAIVLRKSASLAPQTTDSKVIDPVGLG